MNIVPSCLSVRFMHQRHHMASYLPLLLLPWIITHCTIVAVNRRKRRQWNKSLIDLLIENICPEPEGGSESQWSCGKLGSTHFLLGYNSKPNSHFCLQVFTTLKSQLEIYFRLHSLKDKLCRMWMFKHHLLGDRGCFRCLNQEQLSDWEKRVRIQ